MTLRNNPSLECDFCHAQTEVLDDPDWITEVGAIPHDAVEGFELTSAEPSDAHFCCAEHQEKWHEEVTEWERKYAS